MTKPESDKAGAKGPGTFVTEAYNLEDQQSMKGFYAKWAEDYDHQMLDELGYVSPALISKALLEQLDTQDAQILDLGCGTGLTVLLLAEAGFRNLHGIDLSEDMVRVAGSRGIYRDLKVGDITLPLDYESGSLDAVISSGTFTHGHVGPEPLTEICRILKPGGTIACTVHKDLWESMGFRDEFERLTEDAVLEQISLQMDRFYESGEPEGWFCVYRKSA